jgi:ethanolamine utilization protein EutA (predicted chaperonin)
VPRPFYSGANVKSVKNLLLQITLMSFVFVTPLWAQFDDLVISDDPDDDVVVHLVDDEVQEAPESTAPASEQSSSFFSTATVLGASFLALVGGTVWYNKTRVPPKKIPTVKIANVNWFEQTQREVTNLQKAMRNAAVRFGLSGLDTLEKLNTALTGLKTGNDVAQTKYHAIIAAAKKTALSTQN